MITVLVIDGDPAVRLTIRRVLERAGFAVFTAADMSAALRPLGSLKMDLVICQIDLLGAGAADAIAELVIDPATPILALSDKDDAIPAAAPHGAVATLGKPFTESELLGAVRRSLARPAARSV
jgi:DNA-binding response OmpR family regulator